MSKPLFLFITLLGVLSISIYFGNANVSKKEGLEGEDEGEGATTPSSTTPTVTTPAATTPTVTTPACNGDKMSDYYKWFEYWNKVVKSENIDSALNASDYILKTQVIPPVCPSCPSCSTSNGVCTSCGGQGGSGTNGKYRNRFSDFIAIYGSGYKGNGNWAGFGGNGDGGNSKHRHNGDDSVTGLLRDTGSGVKDLLEDTGSGAKDLLEDTGSGATSLLRDAASGAVGLLRDAGSGVAGVLKTNPLQIDNRNNEQSQSQQYVNNPYQTGYYTQGTYNHPNNPLGIQGIDPYSYNGALVSKGSNYIPVTSDFSSFRK